MSTVTIKVKELMTLDETIKYAWENDIRSETYFSEDEEDIYVNVDEDGDITLYNRDFISEDDKFTVYVEVTPDEDTVFPKVLLRTILDDYREVENFTVKEYKNMAKQVYLMKYDKVSYLLWDKEKGFID